MSGMPLIRIMLPSFESPFSTRLCSATSLSGENGDSHPPVPISQDTAFPVQRRSAPRHLDNLKKA